MRAVPRGLARVVAVVTAGAFVISAATAASAAPADDGFWYFDIYGVQDAHDAGLTGEGVTIAVLDSQINLDVPTLQGADIEVQDAACYEEDGTLISAETTDLAAEHATNIVSYLVGSGEGYPGQTGIKGIVPDAKIIFTSVGRATPEGNKVCFGTDPDKTSLAMANGIYAAIDAGADIISVSVQNTPDSPQLIALTEALNKGIVVIAPVSNDLLEQDSGQFPATGNGVIGVQSMDASLTLQGDTAESEFDNAIDSNTDVVGAGVNLVWQGDSTWEEQRYATGTSLATPVVAGLVGLVAQKYPKATGNQLIQTLIRNTGRDDHELEFDDTKQFGYGVVSLSHMLRVDPTQYDDVNPLIFGGDDQLPTSAMIANPPTLEEYDPSYGEAWNSEDPVDPGSEGVPVLPILIGIVGFLIVAGGVVLVAVLISRRKRNTPTPPPGGQV